MNGIDRKNWNLALAEAVVTGDAAASCQEPPRADEVRAGLGGGARAGQEVVHQALPHAYLLRGALEHGEQQGDEAQQHQLFFDLEEGLVQWLPAAFC